jgi:DNA-binding FadR family transcriptional regulator
VNGERVNGRVRIPEHVVHRDFGEQTVLLNLSTGQYHGLNRTGRRMFELLEERGTLEGIAAQLAAEYQRPEAEIAADLVDLCAALSERGLLEIDVNLRD